jgi:6-pyruvoyltetrahydropterin/6-carboxytetrahydropterin synthase
MNQKVSGSYAVAVKRDFVGQHFLFGGDWGPENSKHSHHYQVELQLHGAELDQHGYLVDIVDIEAAMDEIVAYFKDKTLNELPEFSGLNPSIEHLSRIICEKLTNRIKAPNISRLLVKIWENEIAWAAYSRDLF